MSAHFRPRKSGTGSFIFFNFHQDDWRNGSHSDAHAAITRNAAECLGESLLLSFTSIQTLKGLRRTLVNPGRTFHDIRVN